MSSSPHLGRRTRRVPYKKDSSVHAAAPQSNINVTPLVDVCLVLLIIFMVVTPMLGRGRDVQLPTLVEAAQHKEGDQVFVSVDEEGAWVNQEPFTSRGDFQDALRREVQLATGKATATKYEGPILFLKGDKGTNFGRVRVVMEWIEGAGVQDIALVVDTGQG
ncbi:MAG: biopolymer transporter ExbD [Deltaproteobacteria bacterium]|nr:biopolymer transporter ExbD [Deltaproteobacteria bacterium]